MPFARTPFDDWMDTHAALVNGKWFYGRVAGTSHSNANGTSRQDAIADLKTKDELQLVPDPDNEFDKNAILLLAPDGRQVGHVEARLAGETIRRAAKGFHTRAFVSNLTGRAGQPRGVVLGFLTQEL